jgi:hypothetical protein
MSPVFGHRDEKKQAKEEQLDQWRAAVEAESDRLNSLSLAQLATEVMNTFFGRPDADEEGITVAGGNFRTGPSVYRITGVLMAAGGIDWPDSPMKDRELQERIVRLVAEGVQELEHASLVRAQMHDPSPGGPDYVTTRRGRAALERSEVERLLAGPPPDESATG